MESTSALPIISCESYGRSSEIDVHKKNSGESIPWPFASYKARKYDK